MKTKAIDVTILVCDMPSGPVLSTYQISSKLLELRSEQDFIKNVTRGHTQETTEAKVTARIRHAY